MNPTKVDVAIVGAGSAGAAAASFCAHRGMVTACVEAESLDLAGARWTNLMPVWFFEEAGLPPPQGGELRGEPVTHHLYAGWGPQRITFCESGFIEVDMPRLISRLQEAARAAGALLYPDTLVVGWDGRLLHTTAGAFEPRWVVDASGLGGARLLGQPDPHPEDICVAMQETREVRDLDAARAFWGKHQAGLDHRLSFAGLDGGFSVIALFMHGENLALLSGSIPADGHPPGREIQQRFVESQPWIGARIDGGQRAIPLRRPYEKLAQGRVALLGDAAAQVFSPHGSGTGLGLVGARMLADALSEGRGVEGYATAFQRKFGGTLAAFAQFRRFSQALAPGEMARLMDSGLMSMDIARGAMIQRLQIPKLPALARASLGALQEPRLASRLLPVLGRMALLQGLYAGYPRDHRQLPRFCSRLRQVGLLPDPL